ncbi:insulinase family protein [Patescibacteria group bacterium]|nr:insulinase family protein [Patescibacteria group bacterium]
MNKFKVKTLANGIPLYLVPLKEAKTATIMFMFKTGSKYENRQNSGISHFLEHMFFKGTKKRPDTATISSELDSLGSEFNAFTGKEYTGYFVKTAALKIRPAIKILGDMLLNSLFDEKEIEREKGVIIEELNMYEDNPLMHIEDVFESCLYGDTPAGWDTIGTKETIRSFKRQDFIDYFKTQYGTKGLSIILAGKVSPADINVLEKIALEFKDNAWRDKLKVKENQTKPAIKSVFKATDQIALSLGVRTVPAGHPEELKLKMLALVLGGSMSSRLFIKLRERNGLAYFVKTMTEFYSDSGYLTTQAGVPVDKAKEAVKIILEEYKNIAKEKISEKELKKAKDLLAGKMALRLEATDEIASWYARQAVTKNNVMTPAEALNKMRKITITDLQKTAKKFFVEANLNLAVMGKVKTEDFKKVLKLR